MHMYARIRALLFINTIPLQLCHTSFCGQICEFTNFNIRCDAFSQGRSPDFRQIALQIRREIFQSNIFNCETGRNRQKPFSCYDSIRITRFPGGFVIYYDVATEMWHRSSVSCVICTCTHVVTRCARIIANSSRHCDRRLYPRYEPQCLSEITAIYQAVDFRCKSNDG